MTEARCRSWRSVSLRTLLLFTLACGCGLGRVGREKRAAERRAQVVQELSKAASKIEIESVDFWGRKTGARPPAWQTRLLGGHYFRHVTRVVIERPDLLPADGAVLGELRHLRSLEWEGWIEDRVLPFDPRQRMLVRKFNLVESSGGPFTDQHAAGLNPLRQLENISLAGSALSDQGVMCLSPKNPLRSLDLSYTQITDRGVQHLARCSRLVSLDLSHTWVTDAGMKHLARLPQLKRLRLRGVMVSDEGLQALSQSKSLQSSELDQLAISPAGVAELAKLPKLQSLKVDGAILTRNDVQSLQDASRRSELLAHLESPSALWAIDRSYAPNGEVYLSWLLNHGADPTRANLRGETPYEIAERWNRARGK